MTNTCYSRNLWTTNRPFLIQQQPRQTTDALPHVSSHSHFQLLNSWMELHGDFFSQAMDTEDTGVAVTSSVDLVYTWVTGWSAKSVSFTADGVVPLVW